MVMRCCSVLKHIMRWLGLLSALLLSFVACAQPGGPDLTFLLVRDAKGRSMKGPYVESALLREALRTKGTEPWSVEIHFTVAEGYAYGPEKPGDHKWWPLTGSAMQARGKDRLVFNLFDCWCTDFHVQVMQGDRIMRIDLPDEPADRWALVQRVMTRSGDHASPEVFRFRAGRFSYAELADDPACDGLEKRIAQGLEQERDVDYERQLAEQEEYYRNLPPVVPSEAQPHVPVITNDEILQESAERPSLKELEIARQHADTLWLLITGGVMLDGGCASGMPQFGIEMLTDTGWLERHVMDRSQMDCGLPWMVWKDRTVMLPPLRWWVSVNSPPELKELLLGTYRLVLMGANGELKRTEAFELK